MITYVITQSLVESLKSLAVGVLRLDSHCAYNNASKSKDTFLKTVLTKSAHIFNLNMIQIRTIEI